jgi:UDP:flavonoid glycosyltransferase YjiC (YdhE family)
MAQKILLFAPAAYSLAETTRMIEIAKGIRANESANAVFAIQFVSEGGKFEQLIEDEGFPLKRIEPRISEEKIAQIFAVNDEEKLGTVYTKQEMIAKVKGDVAYLKELKPTAVITGSYLSMPVACQVAEIPLVWTIQSTWLKEFFASGAGVTDGITVGPLKKIADFIVYRIIKAWMWYGFINPVNKAAQHFGVKPYKPVLDYFRGDITLVAEPAEFSEIKLPENYYYTGPLIANQDFPLPTEVKNIPRDKPLIYFAMGSSGTPRIVAQIIESFRGKPYQVISPVKSLLETLPATDIPPNVLVTDWLPALEVNKMVDLSVIHGGIGTVMTAAYAGKPVIGVGMQPEQVANIACLVRKGFAIRVPKSKNLAEEVQKAIQIQLHDEEAKRKAEAFAKLMEKWDGPKMAAALLYEKYGQNN